MEETPQKPPVRADVLFALFLNVGSSVAVVFANKKLVYQLAGFDFATALTVIHFVFCAIACGVLCVCGLFPFKSIPFFKVLGLCFAFSGYVVFNNLSLQFNTVSFYQTAKIICTPFIILIEFIVRGSVPTTSVLISLIPTLIGVFITVWEDTGLNLWGTIWAALAIVANSLYTVWGKTKQNEFNVGPMQLLLYQAPISAALLTPFIFAFDNYNKLINFTWSTTAAGMILVTCVLAFGVNFSFFLFVGKTTPLSANMLGYFKTCLVYIGGFIFFANEATPKLCFGIGVTLLGLFLYARAKDQPAPKREQQNV